MRPEVIREELKKAKEFGIISDIALDCAIEYFENLDYSLIDFKSYQKALDLACHDIAEQNRVLYTLVGEQLEEILKQKYFNKGKSLVVLDRVKEEKNDT